MADEKEDSTNDSNIEHINNLIANPDDLVVEQPDASFKDAAEEETREQDDVQPNKQAEPKPAKVQNAPKTPVKQTEPKSVKTQEKHKQSGQVAEKRVAPKMEKRSVPMKATPLKRIEIKSVKKVEHKRIEPKHIARPKQAVSKSPVHKMAARKINMKKKNDSPKLLWLWIVVAVIFVVAVAFLLYKNTSIVPVQNKTSSEVAALVNGDPIYTKDINDQYNALSPVMQQQYSKEYILNQTIDELLLVQYADKLNIKIDSQAVSDEVNVFKIQNGLSEQQFQDVLKQQNMTVDQLRQLIEKRLKVKQLLNQTILSNITVTSAEALKYYNDNIVKFKQGQQVKVQHILVAATSNFTVDQAKTKIDGIYNMLNSTNFCDLVVKYTDDTASKPTCGVYTFGAGEMDPDFENASFSLDINATAVIKSVYGWHIIKKLANTPAGITPFENVASDINTTLYDQKAQQNFDSLLVMLRQQAVIVNYLAKPSDQPAPVITPVESANTTGNTTIVTTVSLKNYDSFAQCLTNKSVVFYGAYWSNQSLEQKAMFANSFKYVTYVECGVADNMQLETADCQKAQISGYPTWNIGGKNYAGEQTLTDLARLAGCSLPQ